MSANKFDKDIKEKPNSKKLGAGASNLSKILGMDAKELCDFMADSSGNYIVQEVFKVCSPNDRVQIMEKIKDRIVNLSWHKKGTHTIQTLVLECKTTEEISKLFSILDIEKMQLLSSDSYGTFVMQKVVDKFPPQLIALMRNFANGELFDLQYLKQSGFVEKEPAITLFLFLKDNFKHMSTNKWGLPIIKKALVKFKDINHPFLSVLEEDTVYLAQHPFGNYALQVAIDSWKLEECQQIIHSVLENLQQLSMQKFSSNVVEKCIDKSSHDMVFKFLEMIDNKDFMKMAVRNMYTFFVVERALYRATTIQEQNQTILMTNDQKSIINEIGLKIFAWIEQASDKSLRRKWTKLYESLNCS